MAIGQLEPIDESDEALVLRVTEGDETAFKTLYDRFFQRVYLFVDRRLRNRADTEETVQEIFISIFNSIDSYRGDAPFSAWVFGVTRRTIAGRFKRKRHPTVPLVDEDKVTAGPDGSSLHPSPLEAYECEELLSQIEAKIVSRLSPEQQELFQLHHVEDRSISEIAVTLDKSEDAVKSNLYRARKILQPR
ncbi:MAG: RNA polymerase sigma factor [Myxococcota bacterium]|nr:RNA polymerase sigma factor [Myxococcota bacterium]